MEESLTSNRLMLIRKKYLEDLLKQNYIVECSYRTGYVYHIYTSEKKTFFGKMKTLTVQEKAAEICDLQGSAEVIIVNEEVIYPLLKQFGKEFGYKELLKDWDGASIEDKKQDIPVKEIQLQSNQEMRIIAKNSSRTDKANEIIKKGIIE